MQRLAASAGLAPRVVHVDESRRAVVSAFVVDRSFAAFYFDPSRRAAALALLGGMLRRVHELPLAPDAESRSARAVLAEMWSALEPGLPLPAFVGDAIRRLLDEEPPPYRGRRVLSHNDVNPTNLVYDGEHLLLFDWETAGPNDAFYDLAAISVFLVMDDATCLALLAAYGDAAAALPARFVYNRRLVGVLCGAAFLGMALRSGYAGATPEDTFDTALALGAFYRRLRSGELSLATAPGQWSFGLALVKTGIELTNTPRQR